MCPNVTCSVLVVHYIALNLCLFYCCYGEQTLHYDYKLLLLMCEWNKYEVLLPYGLQVFVVEKISYKTHVLRKLNFLDKKLLSIS